MTERNVRQGKSRKVGHTEPNINIRTTKRAAIMSTVWKHFKLSEEKCKSSLVVLLVLARVKTQVSLSASEKKHLYCFTSAYNSLISIYISYILLKRCITVQMNFPQQMKIGLRASC